MATLHLGWGIAWSKTAMLPRSVFAASRMAKSSGKMSATRKTTDVTRSWADTATRRTALSWNRSPAVRPSLLNEFLPQPDENDEKQLWLILPVLSVSRLSVCQLGLVFSWIKFNNWAAMHLNDLTKLMEWFYLVLPGKNGTFGRNILKIASLALDLGRKIKVVRLFPNFNCGN